LIGGGKGIAWYRDGSGVDSVRPDITTLPMWSEIPKIRSEIDALLPLLREKHWTPWRATINNKYILIDTRDYAGHGHILLQNSVSIPQPVRVTLHNLTAASGIDYFSRRVLLNITGGQFTLTLAPYESKVIRLE
jgi:hypothetical protein